jgi:hypothetical protein
MSTAEKEGVSNMTRHPTSPYLSFNPHYTHSLDNRGYHRRDLTITNTSEIDDTSVEYPTKT